jgi:hypothetical protein
MPSALSTITHHLGRHPFTRAQAQAVGVSRQQLGRLVLSNQIRTVLHGVYQIADDDLALSDRAKAVALVLPPGGVVARRTAAWIFGIDTRAPDQRSTPMAVECVVPRGRTPVRRPGVRCYQTEIEADDVITI